MIIKILVIDDEEDLCEILRFNLEKEGYEVDCAHSAEQALLMDLKPYSLFIVDIMMGALTGFEFAKLVRDNPDVENTPIIFCSALTDEDDKVMGLNIGADDYITKPFTISEVLARVRAVLRRVNATNEKKVKDSTYEPDIVYKQLRINRNEKICYDNDTEVQLTRTEFDILIFLLSHPNKIYSREEIIENVWGQGVVVTNRTIDTNITRLRKKLGNYGNNIVTRQGFGYGFKTTY